MSLSQGVHAELVSLISDSKIGEGAAHMPLAAPLGAAGSPVGWLLAAGLRGAGPCLAHNVTDSCAVGCRESDQVHRRCRPARCCEVWDAARTCLQEPGLVFLGREFQDDSARRDEGEAVMNALLLP